MSGIMRAPSKELEFEIPYSGTRVIGDFILIVAERNVSAAAFYDASGWSYNENYVVYFSDENNVISFGVRYAEGYAAAAFIPGPNHV